MDNKPTTSVHEARIKEVLNSEIISALIKEIYASLLPPSPDDKEVNKTVPPQSGLLRAADCGAPQAWQEIVSSETEAITIDLYSRGMSVRDITAHMKINHGVELSQSEVSSITDKVYPLIKEWQLRSLSSHYPILYLDGLRFKVRESGKILPKVAYLAMGINQFGEKELLGIWVCETEGAKFWMSVMNELKNRGVEDIFIACVDGLRGFPDAIKTIYPLTEVQVCIAHQVRHTIMFLPLKDRKDFCHDLKLVYTAPTESAGLEALHEVMERWPKYKSYLRSWENRWVDLAPFFNYPDPIRRMMYTTNTIENLNRQFRKVTKTTSVFPHEESLIKLLWLAQVNITKNWSRSLHNWSEALAQFLVLFPERLVF
jgi:putative transposase